MKKLAIILLFLFLCFPKIIYANGAGLPPFFKINGKLSGPNPLQIFGITSSTFVIPQDYAPQKYVANEPVNFEIDSDALKAVIVGASLKDIQYKWDFGDGETAEGTQNTHAYTKIGTYILTLFINIYYQDTPAPTQFIDTYLLNIIPDKNYQGLPQAVIKINGTQVGDPLKRNFEVNLDNPVIFDATSSRSSASKIVEYLWNFGDGQTGSQPIMTHKYDKPFNTAVSSYGVAYDEIAVLRVKDSNGFFTDSFIGLRHNPNAQNIPSVKTPLQTYQQKSTHYLVVFAITLFIVICFLFLIIKKRQ